VRKRKGHRPTSLESGGEPRKSPDSQALFQGRVQSANLADKPIEDLLLEKRLADRGSETLLQHLCQNQQVHAGDLKNRIIEIYRRCYELDKNSEQVIPDFVAAYPRLVFDADWLRVLVETEAANRDFRPNGPRSRLFRALATGFRRAAKPEARINRSKRDAQLEAARCARQEIRKDLEKWDNTLNRSTATAEWIAERATAEAAQLVAGDSRLKPVEAKLKALLRKGQLYDAANLIAATTYGVRVRALESKQS
jgi:hypothetical protein